MHKQIWQIADLLKAQPQPAEGKFDVNFQDIVKNVIPATPNSHWANLTLQKMHEFEAKQNQLQNSARQISVKVIKKMICQCQLPQMCSLKVHQKLWIS